MLDLNNKEVIGYSVGRNMGSELPMNALGNAIALRGRHEGLIFHSDRGSRYSSRKYKAMLAENGIAGSMSAPGCPYDNSCVESFFASLKKDLIYRKKYDTIEEVKTDIFKSTSGGILFQKEVKYLIKKGISYVILGEK